MDDDEFKDADGGGGEGDGDGGDGGERESTFFPGKYSVCTLLCVTLCDIHTVWFIRDN